MDATARTFARWREHVVIYEDLATRASTDCLIHGRTYRAPAHNADAALREALHSYRSHLTTSIVTAHVCG